MISIIVAYSKENRVIGKDGKIPWALPEDMKHFKEITEGHVVIMGKRTFNSLPPKFKPLPNRVNLVLSRQSSPLYDYKRETYVCRSLKGAISYYNKYYSTKRVFIIGGQSIYEQALASSIIDEVIATEIHQTYDGDIYFPSLKGQWKSQIIKQYDQFNIVRYQKVDNEHFKT